MFKYVTNTCVPIGWRGSWAVGVFYPFNYYLEDVDGTRTYHDAKTPEELIGARVIVVTRENLQLKKILGRFLYYKYDKWVFAELNE